MLNGKEVTGPGVVEIRGVTLGVVLVAVTTVAVAVVTVVVVVVAMAK